MNRHEGTKILPAGVNREYLKFAGICIGNEGKVSAALVKAVTGDRSKLRKRMIPFLNSPLAALAVVTLQNKFVILQWAAGQRSLYNHLARGHSKEQAREAFEQAEIIFSNTYEEPQVLQQPAVCTAGTFHPPGAAGKAQGAGRILEASWRLQHAHAEEPA